MPGEADIALTLKKDELDRLVGKNEINIITPHENLTCASFYIQHGQWICQIPDYWNAALLDSKDDIARPLVISQSSIFEQELFHLVVHSS